MPEFFELELNNSTIYTLALHYVVKLSRLSKPKKESMINPLFQGHVKKPAGEKTHRCQFNHSVNKLANKLLALSCC